MIRTWVRLHGHEGASRMSPTSIWGNEEAIRVTRWLIRLQMRPVRFKNLKRRSGVGQASGDGNLPTLYVIYGFPVTLVFFRRLPRHQKYQLDIMNILHIIIPNCAERTKHGSNQQSIFRWAPSTWQGPWGRWMWVKTGNLTAGCPSIAAITTTNIDL